MSEPDNTQPCRRCGMPGAVLHFPGGYLCQGGCDPDPIMRPIETDPEEGMDEIALRELIATLRTQLKSVEAERDRLSQSVLEFENREASVCPENTPFEQVIKSLRIERDKAEYELKTALTYVTSGNKMISELEADAAVMRSALQLAKDVTSNGFLPNPHTKRFDMTHFDVHATIDKALATNAGKSLLEWKRKAEDLLSRAHTGMHTCETSQWFTDRDAFLNPKPQDVK